MNISQVWIFVFKIQVIRRSYHSTRFECIFSWCSGKKKFRKKHRSWELEKKKQRLRDIDHVVLFKLRIKYIYFFFLHDIKKTYKIFLELISVIILGRKNLRTFLFFCNLQNLKSNILSTTMSRSYIRVSRSWKYLSSRGEKYLRVTYPSHVAKQKQESTYRIPSPNILSIHHLFRPNLQATSECWSPRCDILACWQQRENTARPPRRVAGARNVVEVDLLKTCARFPALMKSSIRWPMAGAPSADLTSLDSTRR